MAKKKRFSYEGLVVRQDDSIDDAKVKNDKLIKKLKKAEREVSKLRTEIKTIQDAWDKTEVFLGDFMGDQDLFDLINQSKDGKLLKIESDKKKSTKCSKCSNSSIKTLIFDKFTVNICTSCNYREKVENNKVKSRKTKQQKG